MPQPQRRVHEHTEDWGQLQQLCLFPEQRRYERMRDVVVFGDSIPYRAGITSTPERSLRHEVSQFERYGLLSLLRPFRPPAAENAHTLSPLLRQLIVDRHAEWPELGSRELATFCYVQYGRHPSPNTVKQILAHGPHLPSLLVAIPTIRKCPPPMSVTKLSLTCI